MENHGKARDAEDVIQWRNLLHMMLRILLFVSLFLVFTKGFIPVSSVFRSRTLFLEMTGGSPDLSGIREKMAADPSYNPLQDPQALQVLESSIPSDIRDFPSSIERLKSAFQDATTGPDAHSLSELGSDVVTSKFKLEDLVSSPRSIFLKDNMPDEETVSESRLQELYEQAKRENPEVISDSKSN
jgi:hypothetical protein